MKWVLDRFEGIQAVLENIETRETTTRARTELPPDAREGDVLLMENNRFIIDRAETTARAARMRERLNRIKNRA